MNKLAEESDEFILEKNGIAFLKIFKPVFYDMFWQAYEVEYLTDAIEFIEKLNNSDFWDDVSFFDARKKCYSSHAIVALGVFDKQGRLIVRGEHC